MEGWIKIHRKLIESNVFKNEKILKVWIWCLLKATHKDYEQIVGTQVVKLRPGQFIFGRNKGADELNMKPSTLYKYMRVLEKCQNLELKCNNKYTVVTIVKWDLYQLGDEKSNSNVTTKEQQRNTNKNIKNIKNNIYSKKNERKYTDEFLNNLYRLGG